jgi:hypothetical protein
MATSEETFWIVLGHHGGVRLASWRWDEYDNIIIFTFMTIFAGLMKLAFHHTGYLAK